MTSVEELQAIAKELRIESLRMIHAGGSGHPGGSLSAAEIAATLYFRVLRYRVGKPDDPSRDRFLISKGHGVPVIYAALARAGCIPRDELKTLRRIDSRLQGHPDHVRLPYVEAATGSLGQGLSVAVGMALAERLDARHDYRVYCLLGDGELQAGQVWEAAMAASKFRLAKLTAIVDYNKVQLDGHVRSVMDLEPLADKWAAFGWNVQQVDGHSVEALIAAFDAADAQTERPDVIIAHTVKGKGVSFMEDTHAWHGKAPTDEELERAIAELEAA
ncbi:MAG TPA: transketolase [Candidatus Limnocylindrales bacterium]|nr:transketolase [Candidatus Limnocylindrales bacterium]